MFFFGAADCLEIPVSSAFEEVPHRATSGCSLSPECLVHVFLFGHDVLVLSGFGLAGLLFSWYDGLCCFRDGIAEAGSGVVKVCGW